MMSSKDKNDMHSVPREDTACTPSAPTVSKVVLLKTLFKHGWNLLYLV